MSAYMEPYSTRAMGIAEEALKRCKEEGVAVSDAVGWMVAIYGNRKYQAGFSDAMTLQEKAGKTDGRA